MLDRFINSVLYRNVEFLKAGNDLPLKAHDDFDAMDACFFCRATSLYECDIQATCIFGKYVLLPELGLCNRAEMKADPFQEFCSQRRNGIGGNSIGIP